MGQQEMTRGVGDDKRRGQEVQEMTRGAGDEERKRGAGDDKKR